MLAVSPGLPRPHVAADRLREEQRCRRAGGVHAHRQSGHVDALGDHPDRDEPAAGSRREVGDACRRAGVVGQHHRRRLAGQSGQHRGVGARRLLVGRDDHGAGIGHAAVALLGEPGVGGLQHRRYPLALRVEHRAPGPRRLLGVQRLAQPGRMLLARACAPARLARVGEEHHRPDHAVGQRLGVAVGVVGRRAHQSLGVRRVGDERDRGVVAAERCARQREASRRVVERLADGVTPTLRVAAVVDLVEHDERATVLGAHPVPGRVAGDLGVGDDDAVVLRRRVRGRVTELRVQRDAHPRGGLRPLGLEVFGRHDDGDLLDDAIGQQLAGDTQGKRCLT